MQDGQLVRRLLDHLGLRLLSPDAVVLEGVMPLLEKLGETMRGEQVGTGEVVGNWEKHLTRGEI